MGLFADQIQIKRRNNNGKRQWSNEDWEKYDYLFVPGAKIYDVVNIVGKAERTVRVRAKKIGFTFDREKFTPAELPQNRTINVAKEMMAPSKPDDRPLENLSAVGNQRSDKRLELLGNPE